MVLIDHYKVLDLPSGDEGAKLTEQEITKRYKTKALMLHPDKRPGYPYASAEFRQLRESYEVLKDPKSREEFHHKRPGYPGANAEFQQLRSSYEILKDPKSRAEFDAALELEKEYDEPSLVTMLIPVAVLSILYVTQVGISMAKRTVYVSVCVVHWIHSIVRNVSVGTGFQ
ncbi:hypothetical protein ACLB2K_008095 [Fragaria x ananassa]